MACMTRMKKSLPRIPSERTAIRVSSSPVGIANIKFTIVKVVWCCSGTIPAFRTLQQEIQLSLNYIYTIAIMVITAQTLKWPFISHRDQHHKHTSQDSKLYIVNLHVVTLCHLALHIALTHFGAFLLKGTLAVSASWR